MGKSFIEWVQGAVGKNVYIKYQNNAFIGKLEFYGSKDLEKYKDLYISLPTKVILKNDAYPDILMFSEVYITNGDQDNLVKLGSYEIQVNYDVKDFRIIDKEQ